MGSVGKGQGGTKKPTGSLIRGCMWVGVVLILTLQFDLLYLVMLPSSPLLSVNELHIYCNGSIIKSSGL